MGLNSFINSMRRFFNSESVSNEHIFYQQDQIQYQEVDYYSRLQCRIMPANKSWNAQYKPRNLLTKTEALFFQALRQAIPEYEISFKTRLADILQHDRRDRTAFNRIKSKHVDFVVLDHNLQIVAVIELDDKSHLRQDRIERDYFVDQVLSEAGINVIHIWRDSFYDTQELRNLILGLERIY